MPKKLFTGQTPPMTAVQGDAEIIAAYLRRRFKGAISLSKRAAKKRHIVHIYKKRFKTEFFLLNGEIAVHSKIGIAKFHMATPTFKTEFDEFLLSAGLKLSRLKAEY